MASIQAFKRPEIKLNVPAFLGITGYYNHYIEMYAEIASPLTGALRKNGALVWAVGKVKPYIS